MIERHIDRHSIRFEPPETLHFVLMGDVSAQDAEAMAVFAREHIGGRPFILAFLDVGDLRAIPAETRKVAARLSAEFPYRGIAFYHASFRARVVTTLLGGALRLFSPHLDNPLRYFDTEAEARLWLAERARELSEPAVAG